MLRDQVHYHARDRRSLLKLVGADSGDLVGLNADALVGRIEARIGQIDDQTRRIVDLLNRGNERAGRKNLDGWAVFLLDDAKAFDGGSFGGGGLGCSRLHSSRGRR